MSPDNYLTAVLEKVSADLRERCPNFAVGSIDGALEVRGGHPVTTPDGTEVTRFSVKIQLPSSFPDELPVVFETGNRIPRNSDRHTNPNGSCCVGVPAALRKRLGRNFKVSSYILGPMSEYFLGQALVEIGEPWPAGEARHGPLGVLDFWQSFFPDDLPRQIAQVLRSAAKTKPPRKSSRCPCGRRQPVRRCHRSSIRRLQSLYPPSELLNDAMAIEVLRR